MMLDEQDVIEALAEQAHASWSGWMKYLFSRSEVLPHGAVLIPPESVARWTRQMHTPYAALSEAEQQSDRQEAAHLLPIVWRAVEEGLVVPSFLPAPVADTATSTEQEAVGEEATP